MALPTASDNVFPKVIESMNTSDPAAPSDSSWKVYAKASGIFARSSNAIVGPFISSVGAGMSNPLTTTGDMIYSSSGTTPARLAVGSNGQFMRTNSTPLPVWDIPPGYEFTYNQFTATVSPNATTEATANTVVTASAVTFDGSTDVMIEFFAFSIRADNGAAGRQLNIYLYEDGTSIGRMGFFQTPAANLDNKGATLQVRRRPTNASHTYSIRASVNAGTGSVGAGIGGAGQDMPGFIRITKV